MFESTYLISLAPWAVQAPELQRDYWKCWNSVVKNFDPKWKKPENADK